MKENKLKILWLALFAVCAGVSCWATANSLRLLLPFGKVMNWLIGVVMAVVFMVIASLGSKLIVDSLNTKVYAENRRMKLLGGIVLMIFFWLVCSMPTNTHTFFYEYKIEEVVVNDLNKTMGYLQQLKDNQLACKAFEQWKTKVEGAATSAAEEAVNKYNPGDGEVFRARLADLNRALEEPYITKCGDTIAFASGLEIPSKMSPVGAANHARTEAREKIDSARLSVEGDMEAGIVPSLPIEAKAFVPQADAIYQQLEWFVNEIDSIRVLNKITADYANNVEGYLFKGYDCVNRYVCYVEFDPKNDEELYHPESGNIVTATSRLKSVFAVWSDYMKGRYKNMGFGYLILLSILLDIAAFIFFDMTFRKDENY